jgi:ABC-type multidrug transport system fused ATPase/permease subunit
MTCARRSATWAASPIRCFCYEKILNANIVMIQGRSEGEIITKVIRDTEKLEKAFSNLFALGMSIARTIALITMLIITNAVLASVIVFLFCIIVLIQKISSKSLKQYYITYKNSEEKLLSDFKNQIAGFFTIKVFSLEDKSLSILKERNEKNLKNHIGTSRKVSIVKNMNFFISSIFTISTVFLGGLLYIGKRINIGQIFSMYTYSIQLASELRNIIEVDIILKDITSSFKRIIDFSREFDNNNENTDKIEDIDKVEFRNVNFMHGEKVIFSDLNFKASKNQIVGLRGQNGSGKTTLTYLICGFYKPEGVLINDIPIQSFSEKEILKNVSYVLQNTFLFPTSIMDNLTCFGEIDKEKVYEVCKRLGIHEKIMTFSEGYNTIVNEKNLNLSGGEKQLIALARAILKESDILILDEMNSAMDESVEDKIYENIKEFFRNKIVFIISHRQKLFDMCDYIIDL